MSRLDSMLRRFTAQRDGLNWAMDHIEGRAGDVLDLGLGNGRTYDHLRERLPDRRIWVIDRILQCHHTCVPPEQDFLQGEAEPMLRKLETLKAPILLAHYDLGFGVNEKDVAEAAYLSSILSSVMLPDGLIVSGQPMPLETVTGPETVSPDRYRFYRPKPL